MWYVVQTPVGRETEAAEKLNRIYSDKAKKPCFVMSKERTGSVTLVQHYPKTTPVIFWSLSILISLMTERQSVRFSSRVKFS